VVVQQVLSCPQNSAKPVSVSVPVPAAKAQSCNKLSASFYLQIFVKIGKRQLVLVGTDESAVLGEVIRRFHQPVTLMLSNIQLISCRDNRVCVNDITFAEASPYASSLFCLFLSILNS
jgi:hypothetical protein